MFSQYLLECTVLRHLLCNSTNLTKVRLLCNMLGISFLYVCMVNTIYLLSFVETPRKFIIAELSIRKLGSSSVLLALMKIRAYGSKALQ